MRGKLPRQRVVAVHGGNIPAYAGKTPKEGIANVIPSEHPRVCGENWGGSRLMRWNVGTSPRMRGKRGKNLSPNSPGRNIPAYAGKTHHLTTADLCLPEHPRVCGENNMDEYTDEELAGTSPRMRGKPAEGWPISQETRNIPAYAGKTPKPGGLLLTTSEHPRVCGENGHPGFPPANQVGTSPRMRGKQMATKYHGELLRNIPAYAGKTAMPPRVLLKVAEHPRVCGENGCLLWRQRWGRGTSPRMRGKLGDR